MAAPKVMYLLATGTEDELKFQQLYYTPPVAFLKFLKSKTPNSILEGWNWSDTKWSERWAYIVEIKIYQEASK